MAMIRKPFSRATYLSELSSCRAAHTAGDRGRWERRMLQWALGALSRVFTAPSAQCTPEQRKTWNGFVDSFTASAINGGSPQSLVLERDGDDRGNGAGLDKGPVTFRPAAKRVVAIGDLHGDYEKCERAFRMAGLIDENRNWVGGETVAVQVGDVLDRGGDEIRIFHFLEELKRQAASHGGALHVLNGNHEILNVAGRFRYATESAFAEFERYEKIQRFGRFLKCKCGVDRRKCEMAIPSLSSSGVEARREALKPGGSISAAFLARNPVALVVGSTVFVHGGLHPRHLKYGVERMNRETSEWIRGDSKVSPPETTPFRRSRELARRFIRNWVSQLT